MAFGAKKIFPIDQKPSTAVGISIPFNAPGVFFSTYTTKDAIRNNLLNFFLTNKTERYLNNDFGANLRAFIFEQMALNNIDFLKEDIQQLLVLYFPYVKVGKLDITPNYDQNELTIKLNYNIINTGINDKVEITFE